ncbi:MAG: aromatic amino acid DMT transporter YddG [Planctomycetaceae bacterium]|nr:aromatic amino acid DMT transporter YddG [Planctomycetaceae bacterium]
MLSSKANAIGLIAVVLWSLNVGMIRSVAGHFGAVAGATLLYTASAVILLLLLGFPKLSTFPKRYLYAGSALFCIYELCFSLSLGFTRDGQQLLEVGMVNYLWPSLTILMAILFNGQKTSWLIVPGMVLAFVGLGLVLGGDQGLDLARMWENVNENPLSYGLAFTGAVLWSVYCTITSRMADGKNGVVLFFMVTALALWINLLRSGESISLTPTAGFYVVIAAAALGLGYAAWNYGVLHGNVTLLATASYFIPVVSSLLTSLIFATPLTGSFWRGCLLTTAGSLICWLATRGRPAKYGGGGH